MTKGPTKKCSATYWIHGVWNWHGDPKTGLGSREMNSDFEMTMFGLQVDHVNPGSTPEASFEKRGWNPIFHMFWLHVEIFLVWPWKSSPLSVLMTDERPFFVCAARACMQFPLALKDGWSSLDETRVFAHLNGTNKPSENLGNATGHPNNRSAQAVCFPKKNFLQSEVFRALDFDPILKHIHC
jgi:hypothetical protein